MFSRKKADWAIEFIARLTHTKGEWAGKPFQLQKWQKMFLKELFGRVKRDGLRQYQTAYLEIPRKNGKALAIDTPIPTPDGWRTMGEMEPGDMVFDSRGKPCRVVATTETMHGHKCYRVSFSDGTSVVADESHLWKTQTRRPENHYDIWTTKEIANSLFVGNRGKQECNHSIPIERCLDLPEADLPVHPYVLGCWLGDGSSYRASIFVSYNDLELIENIKNCGYPVSEMKSGSKNCGDFLVGSYGRGNVRKDSLHANLRKMGVLGDKHIPSAYLRGSKEQRRALLQGLMDTDGYISKAGQCEFSTTKEELVDGFLELARSLGYKPTTKTCRATLYSKDCGPSFRVQFWAYDKESVFRLTRKSSRLKTTPAKRTRSKTLQITGAELVESIPVKCIQVDASDGMFLCGAGMVPTHNSEIAAAIALFLLFGDNEPGAEIYSAAADREQASLVFNAAAQMVRNDPVLSGMCKIIDSQKRIVFYEAGSFYRAISAEAYSKHGFNAHAVIYDEIHSAPNRDLWDVLSTSMGARTQPLMLGITTAGYDRNSICWELHDYGQKIIDGVVEDPTFFPLMFAADEEDDWTDEKVWRKANPNLGVSVKLDFLRRECKRAQEIPAYQNTFRRLYLNQWTTQETRWLDMEKWRSCGYDFDPEYLSELRCWAGVDLSSTTDLSSCALVFEPDEEDRVHILSFSWIPGDNIAARVKRDRVPYDAWARDGHLTATDGNVIDHDYIRHTIARDLKAAFPYLEVVGYDPWNATKWAIDLEGDGVPVVQIRQGYKTMSPACKELERLVLGGYLRHNNNPVLTWAMDNVMITQDPAGNIKPAKDKATERIDPAVALITAIATMLEFRDEPSIYESRGILTL